MGSEKKAGRIALIAVIAACALTLVFSAYSAWAFTTEGAQSIRDTSQGGSADVVDRWTAASGGYSTWDSKSNAMKCPASYANRVKSFSSKYAARYGHPSMKLLYSGDVGKDVVARKYIDTEGDRTMKNDSYVIFDCSKTAEPVLEYKNVYINDPSDDAAYRSSALRGYVRLDMRAEVTDVKVHKNKYKNTYVDEPYVALQRTIRGLPDIIIYNIGQCTVHFRYYYAGTDTPYVMKSNVTYGDIDAYQAQAFKLSQTKKMAVTKNTYLKWKKTDQGNVFVDGLGAVINGKDPKHAVGYAYEGSDIAFSYMSNQISEEDNESYAQDEPNGAWSFFSSGSYSMFLPSPPAAEKTVTDTDDMTYKEGKDGWVKDEKDEDGEYHDDHAAVNGVRDLKDSFTYNIDQEIPAGYSPAFYYNSFVMSDHIDSCLEVESAKVYDFEGNDVSSHFDIGKENGYVTAKCHAGGSDDYLHSEHFYGGVNGERYELRISVKLKEGITFDELSKQGHVSDDGRLVCIENKANVKLDDYDETSRDTGDVKTYFPVPKAEVTKDVKCFEHKVGNRLHYTIEEDQSTKAAVAHNVVISDILPQSVILDASSIKVTYEKGEEPAKVPDAGAKAEGNDFSVSIPVQYYGQKCKITFDAVACEEGNGKVTTNTADVRLDEPSTKTGPDKERVWTNDPHLKIEKSAPVLSSKAGVKVGDTVYYRIKVSNPSAGTLARDVQIKDVIMSKGVSLVHGSVQIENDSGKRLDTGGGAEVTYGTGDDENSFSIDTNQNISCPKDPLSDKEA